MWKNGVWAQFGTDFAPKVQQVSSGVTLAEFVRFPNRMHDCEDLSFVHGLHVKVILWRLYFGGSFWTTKKERSAKMVKMVQFSAATFFQIHLDIS